MKKIYLSIFIFILVSFDLSGQNVGIGTKTPQANLHLVDSFNSAALYIQAVNINKDAALRVISGTSTFSIEKRSVSDGGTLAGIPQANATNLLPTTGRVLFGTQDKSPLHFITYNTERMRIDSVGNVGIGTTTPHAVLDVKGQIISGTYPPVNQAILGICLDNNTNVNAGFTYGVQIEDSLANSIPLKIHFNPPGGSPNMAMEVMTKGWGYCANFIGGEGVVISNDSTHPFPGYYPNVPALQVNNQKGWSDAVSILSKSNVNNFQLQLVQLDSDYTRMDMANAFGKAWTIAALRTPAAATDRLNFYNEQSGADRFIIYGNGDATLAGTLTQSSDARLKKNIRPLHAVLPSLFSLSGYSYNWLDETKGKEMQIGLLAQEVERVYPQLVKTDEQGNKSVAYQNMVPVLLEALKELKTELDSIKQEIKTLKAINNPKK